MVTAVYLDRVQEIMRDVYAASGALPGSCISTSKRRTVPT